MAKFIKDNSLVLDIATGTGDVISALVQKRIVKMAVGIDMAYKMLLKAKSKLLPNTIFIRADAMNLPFFDYSFDVVTIAFGIRNMADPVTVLKEAYRVLKTEGKIVILEFSIPENIIIQKIYLLYLRYILPVVGAIMSGDWYAYRYLNRTIEDFPYGKSFIRLMINSGFKKIRSYPQTFGICTIYVGEKI